MAALVVPLSIFLLLPLMTTMTMFASGEEEDPYKWGCRDGQGGVDEETAAATMQAIIDNMVATLPYRKGKVHYCNVVESRMFGLGFCHAGIGDGGDDGQAEGCRFCLDLAAQFLFEKCSSSGAGYVEDPLRYGENACSIDISAIPCQNN